MSGKTVVGKVCNKNDRGFGFIEVTGDRDMFFHVSGMTRREDFDSLSVGDRVRYEVDSEGERPRAINVELVE